MEDKRVRRAGLNPELKEEIYGDVEGSSFCERMGITLVDLAESISEVEMEGVLDEGQPGGIVPPGSVTGLIAVCTRAALATVLEVGESLECIEQKVNFLRVTSGSGLSCRGRVVQRGKRIAVTEADVSDLDGKLVAKGIATYVIRSRLS